MVYSNIGDKFSSITGYPQAVMPPLPAAFSFLQRVAWFNSSLLERKFALDVVLFLSQHGATKEGHGSDPSLPRASASPGSTKDLAALLPVS